MPSERGLGSELSTYNALDQLTGTQVGNLENGVLTALRRDDLWNLDVLGNWNAAGRMNAGNQPLPGRVTSIFADGSPGTKRLFDFSDNQNRIDKRTEDTGSSGGSTPTHLAYDANGNLLCDGSFYYQYDAWNRLMQVNRAVAEQLPTGQTVPASDGVTLINFFWKPGVFLKHFTYDGQGRVMRVLSPFPNPDAINSPNRSEQFYYDGIRRIQEVVADQLPAQEVAAASALPGVSDAALDAELASAQPLDPKGTPIVVEQAAAAAAASAPPGPTGTFLNREYIWGPGDAGGRGVDELLVQYDWQRNALYAVMDDGGDLVALCDRNGPNAQGRVVAQYTYDAYGQVLTAAHLAGMSANAYPHLGHKGLFVDRLDTGIVASGNYETPRLIPLAQNLVQNRNRAYSPQLGRFLQADPNETGMAVPAAEAFQGGSFLSAVQLLSLLGHYDDGMSHYGYLASNPARRSDPLGLSLVGGELELSVSIGMMAFDLVSTYSVNQQDDLDWAMDAGMPDDAYSRLNDKWVREILAKHVSSMMEHAFLGPIATAHDLYELGHDAYETLWGSGMSAGERMAAVVLRGARLTGAAFRVLQIHHALPRYIAYALYGSREASKILIKIPKKLHLLYHAEVDAAIRALGEGIPHMRAGARALERWIGGNPERAVKVLEALKTATRRFEGKHKLTGLVKALMESLKLVEEAAE